MKELHHKKYGLPIYTIGTPPDHKNCSGGMDQQSCMWPDTPLSVYGSDLDSQELYSAFSIRPIGLTIWMVGSNGAATVYICRRNQLGGGGGGLGGARLIPGGGYS